MRPDGAIVIPWRGFRCFTQAAITALVSVAQWVIVIPWRGFRCFTPVVHPAGGCGFRDLDCNPLAGIWVFHTDDTLAAHTLLLTYAEL